MQAGVNAIHARGQSNPVFKTELTVPVYKQKARRGAMAETSNQISVFVSINVDKMQIEQ